MIDITTQPPRMSRALLNELLEYRTINCIDKCSTCGRIIPKVCEECGQPLQVSHAIFCKRDNCQLVLLYSYHDEDSIHPILVCPICGVIDWWADEDSITDKEEYFRAINNFHKSQGLIYVDLYV